jgi:hypothetical protein
MDTVDSIGKCEAREPAEQIGFPFPPNTVGRKELVSDFVILLWIYLIQRKKKRFPSHPFSTRNKKKELGLNISLVFIQHQHLGRGKNMHEQREKKTRKKEKGAGPRCKVLYTRKEAGERAWTWPWPDQRTKETHKSSSRSISASFLTPLPLTASESWPLVGLLPPSGPADAATKPTGALACLSRAAMASILAGSMSEACSPSAPALIPWRAMACEAMKLTSVLERKC